MHIFCVHCGTANSATARFCSSCRKLIALPGTYTVGPAAEPRPRPIPDWPPGSQLNTMSPAAAAPWPSGQQARDQGNPQHWPPAPQRPPYPPPTGYRPPPTGVQAATGQNPYPPCPAHRPPEQQAPITPPPLPPFDPTPYAQQTDYSMVPAVQHPGHAAPVTYQIDPRTGLPFDPQFMRDLATSGRYSGQPAAFFPRLGALLVDYCILSVLWFFLIGFAAFIDSAALGLLATFIGPALYFIAFWATSGRTPGYRAAGLHLVHTDGSKVGVGASIVRYIGSMISWPLFCLGYLWMLWDPAGQTWHDKMADTTVVQS